MTLLEFVRRTRRLTQAELASAVGCSQNAVSTAERGARVDARILRSLATHLGLRADQSEALLLPVPESMAAVPPPPDFYAAVRAARDRR